MTRRLKITDAYLHTHTCAHTQPHLQLITTALRLDLRGRGSGHTEVMGDGLELELGPGALTVP